LGVTYLFIQLRCIWGIGHNGGGRDEKPCENNTCKGSLPQMYIIEVLDGLGGRNRVVSGHPKTFLKLLVSVRELVRLKPMVLGAVFVYRDI
jgi:hypothetical protein